MSKQISLELALTGSTGQQFQSIGDFGVNSCHACLWLRDDLPLHFKRLRQELGMRYVRCHNIFGDEMGVVSADGKFDFTKPNQVLQRILDNDQKPFLELSSMPGAYASNEKTVCFYNFRSGPPKEWSMWRDLLTAFMTNLQEHFGLEEMRQWYYEVWNEPDLPFWTGDQAGYFRLYDIAYSVIKALDPQLRVGGPATSKTAWIADFVNHVAKPSPENPDITKRCDFVSTHAYPSDLPFLNQAEGEIQLQSADLLGELFTRARQTIDEVLGKDIPLLCGEWNSSAGPLAFNHDECGNCAFILKTLNDLRQCCVGSLYWNGTDIYEECDFHYVPFHGGYGVLNVNSLPKSSYHAFRFLHEMAGEELTTAFVGDKPKPVGALATKSGDITRILLWNYQDPTLEGCTVEIKIPGLTGTGSYQAVRPGKGSAYETWRQAGSPQFTDLALLQKLEAASHPEEGQFTANDTIVLAPGESAMITL